jgi:hypothetical protein
MDRCPFERPSVAEIGETVEVDCTEGRSSRSSLTSTMLDNVMVNDNLPQLTCLLSREIAVTSVVTIMMKLRVVFHGDRK